MPSENTAAVVDQKPNYERPKQTAHHLKITRSTLYRWVAQRADFPRPIQAGPGVTLFDLNSIDRFLKEQSE